MNQLDMEVIIGVRLFGCKGEDRPSHEEDVGVSRQVGTHLQGIAR